MKLLFCYDGPIEKDENGNYYSNALNDAMFSRYHCISKDITIAIRVNKMNNEIINGKNMPLSSKKYKIIECPNLSTVKGIFFKRKECYKILKKAIKQNDAIIIRLPSMIGNMAVKIAKEMKKKYLIEMVGCPWDALWNYNLKGKIVAPFMKYATKKSIINAEYVLYVSNFFLQKKYPTKGKTISCSNVIIDEIDNNVIKRRINKIQGMKNEKKLIIGTLGAIDINYKGQQYVIRAIKDLIKKGYNIEYQIVGGGKPNNLNKVIKKCKVEKNVKILGPKKHDEIFSWIDNLDIYVQPSNQEGLCRSIIEAMSRGCPVIASNAGGNPELINNDFIFKKKKYKKFICCIEKMKKNNMINEANNNYNNSMQYKNTVLKNRRTLFLIEYAREINK